MVVAPERRTENVPRHVAVIMDANGRWAETRGLRRARAGAGLGGILGHTACDYRAQGVFGDQVEGGVRGTALGRTSFTSAFEARRVRDDAGVAVGKSVQAVFDYDADRTTPIPDGLRAKLEGLMTGPVVAS